MKILVGWIGLHTQWVVDIFRKGEEFKYPCSTCLVSVMCSKICDRVLQPSDRYNRKIETFVEKNLKKNKCPDCGRENSIIKESEGFIIFAYTCSNCNHAFLSNKNRHFFFGRGENVK